MGESHPDQTLLILAGPTGTGKSELAMELARRARGGIITADSMQVYRGLAIGTAQPSRAETSEIPHRLVGHVSPTETYDAARFVRDAESALEELRNLRRQPMIVGGTGMYLKSLVEGIFEGPSRDAEIRRRLKEEAERSGPELLHSRLSQVDPEAAAKIMPRDTVRIVRALEVYEATGRRISDWREEGRRQGPRHHARYVVATREREDLYERINRRVGRMLEAGWIEEVRGLLEDGVPSEAPGFRALGYREIIAHLRGEVSLKDLPEAIALATRQYAKRQLIWFRAVKEAVWINLTSLTLEEGIKRVGGAWNSGQSESE